MNSTISNAISQVDRIALLCEFLESPGVKDMLNRSVPTSMPHSVGALGFDIPMWVGLGIVGLWAALDAYAEREILDQVRPTCKGKMCAVVRFKSATKPNGLTEDQLRALEEIQDLILLLHK